MRLVRVIFALFALAAPSLAFGQATILQGGPWQQGRAPMYVGNGFSQPVVQDSGPAGGGGAGIGLSELGITARGNGTTTTPPFAGQGTGPSGTNFCDYDGPTTGPYHFLCLSPNAAGGALIAVGFGGGATAQPLNFIVNGATYAFPFSINGILGPATSIVNDAACWNNTTGTLLKDCGALVTPGGNNTFTGTNNFTGPFQINSVAQTFPGSGNLVGTSDIQTLTNKSVNASEVNSGTLACAQLPALTGNVTTSAGTCATTAFYTAPGTGGATRTQTSKNFDVVSIVDYGGDPTGVAASDNALTNAFAALATSPSGKITFPRGTYKFTSGKTLTFLSSVAGLSLEGEGSEASILTWPNASGGLLINYASPMNSVHIHDLSFTTGQVGGGVGLKLTQGGSFLNAFATSEISNVMFRGSDNSGSIGSFYWTNGIEINGVSGVNYDSITVYGAGASSGNGLFIHGVVASTGYSIYHNISKSIFNSLLTGLIYGSYTQGVTVNQSNFQNDGTGIAVPGSEVGALSQFMITNSQFFATGNEISILTAIGQVQIIGNDLFASTGNSCVDLNASSGFQVIGNSCAPENGATGTFGIVAANSASSTVGLIQGNQLIGLANGVNLQSGAANIEVADNQFSGVATPFTNGGTNIVVHDNPGYNPVGVTAAITVGASPATICAGASPETDYFNQSATNTATVKLGSGSGPIIGTMSSAALPVVSSLGPNECEVVTWTTTAPTYSKSIH